MPLPGSIAELSREWVEGALGAPEGDLVDLEIDPFADGSVFLGRIARLHLTWRNPRPDLPTTLIAKVPTDDPGGRQVGRLLNTWWREHRFYLDLAPHVAGSVPQVHATTAEPDDERYVLLLEDLDPAEPGDQLDGATPEQARAATSQLAAFQAPWWGSPRTDHTDWLPGIDRPGVSHLATSIETALPHFADRFDGVIADGTVERLRRFVPGLTDWLADLATHPLTVAHADYRVENLLFAGDRVWIVDWQTAMVTGGVTDLAFLCGTNLTVDDRRATEQDLLELYLDGLHAAGVDPDLTRSVRGHYGAAMWWWCSMLANNLSTIDPPDERGRQLFDAMVERITTAATDLT